mgnify:CR=1 FL=1
MKFVIVGRNIEVTPGLRTAVEDKIGKLEKYFNPDTEAHVTLSVEKERQKIEVTIPVKGSIIRSEQVSNVSYTAISYFSQPTASTQLLSYTLQLRLYQSVGVALSELLGHNFFVFCNAETDQVNVVYKRKGDTYGLIEPVHCHSW